MKVISPAKLLRICQLGFLEALLCKVRGTGSWDMLTGLNLASTSPGTQSSAGLLPWSIFHLLMGLSSWLPGRSQFCSNTSGNSGKLGVWRGRSKTGRIEVAPRFLDWAIVWTEHGRWSKSGGRQMWCVALAMPLSSYNAIIKLPTGTRDTSRQLAWWVWSWRMTMDWRYR